MAQTGTPPNSTGYDVLFALYDADHDGTVSAGDFTRLARRIAGAFGRDATSPEAGELVKRYERAWQLVERFDADRDGRVTAEDFRRAMTGSAPPSEAPRGIVDALAWQLLEPFDPSGEGHSRYEKLRQAVASRGARPAQDLWRDLRDAEFTVADTDGDGVLGRQEFLTLVQAFGPSAEEAELAARHMGLDGDSRVTAEEYHAAWQRFTSGGPARTRTPAQPV